MRILVGFSGGSTPDMSARILAEALARMCPAAHVPRLIREADTRQKLFAQGWQAVGTSADGLSRRIKDETTVLAAIIRSRGIKIE